MGARIRLRRTGTTKRPAYRVVVADARTPRDGRFIEVIGYYNPLADPPVIRIDTTKATSWLKKGAQPSTAVRALLARAGVRAG